MSRKARRRQMADNAQFAEHVCRSNASRMPPSAEKDALLEEAANWRAATVRLDRAARLAK